MNEKNPEERRQQMTDLVLGEVSQVVSLATELTALRVAKWPLDAARLRALIISATDEIGLADIGRGYRSLGGTAKTPPYLTKNGVKATDDQIVADVLTGWLPEIAERLQKTIDQINKKARHPRSNHTKCLGDGSMTNCTRT